MKSRAGQRQGEEKSRREKMIEKKESEERRSKMQMHEKVERPRRHCVFPKIWGSGGSKGRLAQAAGAEPSGQMRDAKVHVVVARSTFRSQNLQNTTCSRHVWRFRCRFA